jgi:NAD(P)-dependent dehydrogenase (short-subunit alcohol dehydrogenase family)
MNHVLITGVRPGNLGEALALGAIRRGAKHLVLADCGEEGLRAAAANAQNLSRELGLAPPSVDTHPIDVTDETLVDAMLEASVATYGPVTSAFPFAACGKDGLLISVDKKTGEIKAYPATTTELQCLLNFASPLHLAQKCVELLLQWRRCHGLALPVPMEEGRLLDIVLPTSIAEFNEIRGSAVYSALKKALAMAGDQLAIDTAKFGVAVWEPLIGFVNTPMTQDMDPKVKQRLTAAMALGRFLTPTEVANAILDRLATPAERRFLIDGGMDFDLLNGRKKAA